MQVYFEQDGGSFYIYRSVHAAECADVYETAYAPFPVKDSDMVAAAKARHWFIHHHCVNKDYQPTLVFNGE